MLEWFGGLSRDKVKYGVGVTIGITLLVVDVHPAIAAIPILVPKVNDTIKKIYDEIYKATDEWCDRYDIP